MTPIPTPLLHTPPIFTSILYTFARGAHISIIGGIGLIGLFGGTITARWGRICPQYCCLRGKVLFTCSYADYDESRWYNRVMMVLGIDASLRNTGLVLLDDKGKVVDKWMVRTNRSTGGIPLLLVEIREQMDMILDEIDTDDLIVGIEDAVRVGWSVPLVSFSIATIISSISQRVDANRIHLVNVSSWKALLRKFSGVKITSKEITNNVIREHFKVKLRNEHLNDAFGIALYTKENFLNKEK